MARSENLPVLPQVVSSVLHLADDPNASPKMMEKLIERDPAITAKILRVANSAYYGVNQVGSIGRALSMLGMNAVKSLVVGVAYQQVISGREQAPGYSKLEFWRHSLAVAICCRIIAKLKVPAKAEELYGAGMMHDVGMLVMDRFCPGEFDQAIQFAKAQQVPLNMAEQILFTFDHTQVGAILAEKWGLTPIYAAAVEFHHKPEQDPNHMDTTMIVALADALAHRAGFTNNIPLSNPRDCRQAKEHVGLPDEQLDIIQQVVVQEVLKAQESFHIG